MSGNYVNSFISRNVLFCTNMVQSKNIAVYSSACGGFVSFGNSNQENAGVFFNKHYNKSVTTLERTLSNFSVMTFRDITDIWILKPPQFCFEIDSDKTGEVKLSRPVVQILEEHQTIVRVAPSHIDKSKTNSKNNKLRLTNTQNRNMAYNLFSAINRGNFLINSMLVVSKPNTRKIDTSIDFLYFADSRDKSMFQFMMDNYETYVNFDE